jgi:hypothetical protein
MSDLQNYYDNFCRPAVWACEDADKCGCRGSGWFLSELDTWHECPVHYRGQPNSESSEEEVREWEMLEAGWEKPVVVDAPVETRPVVGERFGVPVYAPDDDIPF